MVLPSADTFFFKISFFVVVVFFLKKSVISVECQVFFISRSCLSGLIWV